MKFFAPGKLSMMLLSCGMAISAHADDTNPQSARIVVENKVLNPVDRRLFGQFLERVDNGELGAEAGVIPGTHELQPGVDALIRQMKIPVIRFPGGTSVDFLDWTALIDNAIGRADPGRPTTIRGKQATNGFGYDEFLRMCERNGTEAIIVLNFRDGLKGVRTLDDAALHAAQLVAYCNAPVDADLPDGLGDWAKLRAKNGHPAPYHVKYFQIGNETWYYRNDTKKMEPAERDPWVECLKAYVKEIRKADPKVRIIVDSYPLPVAAKMHTDEGDDIYAYAFHHYFPSGIQNITKNGQPIDKSTLTAGEIWNAWVTGPAVDADGQATLQIEGLTQARTLGYKIAMTEWNWNGGWWRAQGPPPALDSLLAKAIGVGAYLNAIMRDGDVICLATQSGLVGNGWDIETIRADPTGKTAPFMYPMGMVTTMYNLHHGGELLALNIEKMPHYEQPYQMGSFDPASIAYVDTVATKSDSAVFVHMVNRRFSGEQPMEIDLSAFKVSGREGKLYVMEGRLENKPAAGEPPGPAWIRQDTVKIDGNVVKMNLPARSVVIAEFPLR